MTTLGNKKKIKNKRASRYSNAKGITLNTNRSDRDSSRLSSHSKSPIGFGSAKKHNSPKQRKQSTLRQLSITNSRDFGKNKKSPPM